MRDGIVHEEVATDEPNRAANAAALRLASGMSEVTTRRHLDGGVYGFSSMPHVLLGAPSRLPDDGVSFVWPDIASDHRLECRGVFP